MFMDRVNRVPEDLFEGIAKCQMGLSPPLVLVWMLPWRGQDFGLTGRTYFVYPPETLLGYAFAGLLIWGLLGVTLWFVVSKRFQQLTGRDPVGLPHRRRS